MKFRIDRSLHQLEGCVGVGAGVVVLRSRAGDVRSELGSDRLGQLLRAGSVFGVGSRNLESAEHGNRFRDLRDFGAEGRGRTASDHLDVSLLQAVVRATHAELENKSKNIYQLSIFQQINISNLKSWVDANVNIQIRMHVVI